MNGPPLADAARLYPQALAMRSGSVTLTYAELARQVDNLAPLAAPGPAAVPVYGDCQLASVLDALVQWRAGKCVILVSRRQPLPAVRRRLAALELGSRPLPEGACSLIFTSGSSGEPKAALHLGSNHTYSALGSNRVIPLAPGDRWLLALPICHVGGLAIVWRCLLAGAAIVFPRSGQDLGQDLLEQDITHLSVVATQLQRLLAWPGLERLRPRLKCVLGGGGPFPPGLVAQARAAGLPLRLSYGSTEMASQICTTAAADPLDPPSAGIPLPYRELRLAGNGEILVRGLPLFAGYLGPQGLDPARDAEGWFHTGDTGRLDAQGRLHVGGRLDRMFISGGENVQPAAIEAVLARQPGVELVFVVPVPDAEFGQRPVAFLRGPADPETLRGALAQELPRCLWPRRFLPLPPEAITGLKPDLQLLQRLASEQCADS